MRFGYPRGGTKPQLGSQIYGNNFAVGLQIAALFNEFATQGPIILTGSPVTQIHNLLGRNNGVGSGTLGPSAPQLNWVSTKNGGTGYRNNSASTGGAIDFGALSNFNSFVNGITWAVIAAWDTAGNNNERAMVCGNGSNNNFVVSMSHSNTMWQNGLNTVGGFIGANIGSPKRSSDPSWVDFIVNTYDGVSLKGYLNGILTSTLVKNSPVSFDNTAHVEVCGTTFFNNVNDNAPVTAFFLWNRALTYAEIQTLYLDPYWSLTAPLPNWRSRRLPRAAIPPPTPSGSPSIPLVGSFAQTKSGYGINQKIIQVPEMNSFDEVRQVLARAIGELQNHIATQLPVVNYKQNQIKNVAPPTEADDVVTLKYLQSVQLPPQPNKS